MKNHKWIDNFNNGMYHKSQKCSRCGITRQWLGRQFQRWEYTTLKQGVETFKRPDCTK